MGIKQDLQTKNVSGSSNVYKGKHYNSLMEYTAAIHEDIKAVESNRTDFLGSDGTPIKSQVIEEELV